MKTIIITFFSFFLIGTFQAQAETKSIEEEVANVERAFAKTMADRDFEAFASFLDEEAVFMASTPARGKAAVMERWKNYYIEEDASFSWEPETVLVLESGNLAISFGPVRGRDGTINAYFQSTWRKNDEGEWKVVFDRGQRYCPPPAD